MKLNLKEWKKVGADDTYIVMKNKDGHELKIAKKFLSHKMREELAQLPEHKAEGGQVKKPGIPGGKGSPALDKSAAQKSDEYYKHKAEHPLEESVENAKKAFDKVTSYFANGGEVKKGIPGGKGSPAFDKSAAQKSDDYYRKQAESKVAAIKGVFGFANGGEASSEMVDPAMIKDSPEKIAADAAAMAAQQPAPPPAQAPVIVNVGQAPQAPMPQQVAPSGMPVNPDGSVTNNMLPPGQQPQPVEQQIQAPQAQAPMPQAAAPQAQQAAPQGLASGLQSAISPQQPAPMDESGALHEQRAGIMAEAAATGRLGKEEAAILQDSAKRQEAIMADFEKRQGQMDQMHQQMVQQLEQGKVDPTRYWESKSTLGKVSTIIGLILGGGAAGYLGKENLALETLNKNIDRDILAQKENLSSKNNLMQLNMQYLKDAGAAAAATKAMQLDYTSTMLKQAAAKASDPIAKARAMQAAGPLDLMAAQYRTAANVRATLSDLERKAKGGTDPSAWDDYIGALEKVDPKKAEDIRSRLVPGIGVANTTKDRDELVSAKATLEDGRSSIKRLLEINKIPGKALTPALRAEAETIQQMMVGILRLPITGPGAMSDGERQLLENIIANPTKAFVLDSTTKTKLMTLEKKLGDVFQHMASSKGVSLPSKVSQLNPQQQSFARWAQQNINSKDPATAQKAQMVLQKLGL